jgi:50S ribosomal subunit-associated GTPase HflX
LRKLKLDGKPRITVINKMDRVVENLEEAQSVYFEVKSPPESTIAVSALKRWNLNILMEMMGEFLAASNPIIEGTESY